MGTMTGPVQKLIAAVKPHVPDLNQARALGGGDPSSSQHRLTSSMWPGADSVDACLTALTRALRIPIQSGLGRPSHSVSSAPRFLMPAFAADE